MPRCRAPSPATLRRLTLRVGVLTLATLTAGCLEDFGKLMPRANSDASQPDQTAPVAATDLGWVQVSPTPMASVTARWTLSASGDVATQEIQLHADAACGNPHGGPVSIPSAAIVTYNFSGNDLASYSFKVTSIDDAGNRTASDCSAAISIALTEAPSVTLRGPSASPVRSTAALTYTVNYERAASVTLDSTTPVSLDTTGSASCDVTVSGSGNVERTVTLSHCTGDGTVAFRLAPGTSSNLAGSDAGAGPANPVVVDNTAPLPATSPGWLQASPSAVTSITAGWTVSADPGLASQAIELHAGTGCSAPLGPPVALGSTTTSTHNFTGNDSSTYSVVVASTDQAGNTATSSCSPAITIHTSGVPTLALSSPSVSRVAAAGTASYAVVYTNADAINADVTAISLVTTGSASCQLALRGTGATTRFADLTNCTGDGSVAIAVAPGTAANLSGTDGGAGPSTPVTVDNTGPADAQALGWSASSPTTFVPITATWSPSTDAHLTDQSLQPYVDDHCGAPDGAATIFGSAVTANADLSAQAGSTYSYRITSRDDLGHASVSPCSTPLIVSPVAGPSISIANSSLDAGGSTDYQVSGGTGALSVWVSGAGTVSNAGGDGTYSAPAQCGSGTDTLYVSDARGHAASVIVDYAGDPSYCDPLQIGAANSDVGPGASTDYSVSGGQGGYSVTVDNGWVDNTVGDGNYYAPFSCDGGTATLTVTDSNAATATTLVNYSGDVSQCAPQPLFISVGSSYISGDGSTAYYISGGDGSYSVSVENLAGSGAVGSIDNSAGSGTYYISPGSCDSGNSGTDQINVRDSNGQSASVLISWAASTCDPGLSISVSSTDVGPGSSTSYSVSGGTGSYSISVDSGSVDSAGGDGNYYAPYGCDGGTATLTVTDSNGTTASAQVNYAGDSSQCGPPPVSISVDSSSIAGDGSTSYYVSGGSGSYSVSVENLGGSGAVGSIDNGAGSGTYYISPGACDSGNSGTDQINVSDTNGQSASVQVGWAAGTCDPGLSISVMSTDLGPGSSTYYSVSGGQGGYSITVDNGSVDNPGGDGNYYAPYGCDGGTATLTVTDSNGATATTQVNYSGDGSQCAPPPVSISVDSSSITGDGSTSYYISGGSGNYSVSVQNLGSGGPAGWIDNGGGSGTYYISPGSCDSGYSGTDEITVWDANDSTSASVEISWGAGTCNSGLSISVMNTDVSAGSSTYYSVSGGTGSYSIAVDSGSVDNSGGDGNYYAPYGCDGGTATLTVTDSNGATATAQVNYAGDGSQCAPPPVSISVDSSSISGDGTTNYYISGGSGNYKVAVQNLWGSGPTGSIDNGGGSGTYSISPGACDSGDSGTDEITVWDGNDGTSASVQISWGAATCK